MPLFSRTCSAIAVLAILVASATAALSAVTFEFSYKQNAPFRIGGPWGVAVDDLGDAYATDTNAHRIVKFDSAGNPIKAWGTEGSLAGQLYYPTAIATNTDGSGNVRVYVADNGNSRIVTYTGDGQFLSAFGSEGSGLDQLDHPSGIAILKSVTGRTEEICVADTRNARVTCFNEQGQPVKIFNCRSCEGGKFVAPGGIYARRLKDGSIRYYVSDNYPARVVVLNGLGRYVKTIGGPRDSHALGFPDDLVVDETDGSIYVVDSGIGYERITKFNADGTWQFDFGHRHVPFDHLTQPHAIAMDADGDLVVGHFAEPPMNKFDLAPPRITAVGLQTVPLLQWGQDKKAYLYVTYNGIEQDCVAQIKLSIRAEGHSWVIRTSIDAVVVSNASIIVGLPLTTSQVLKLYLADVEKRRLNLVAENSAVCVSDGKQFSNKSRSSILPPP